ncbi:MAG: alpha/beta fold hydrolase [Myxococcales bacterium]
MERHLDSLDSLMSWSVDLGSFWIGEREAVSKIAPDDGPLEFTPHPLLKHPVAQTLAGGAWWFERELTRAHHHEVVLRDGDQVGMFEDVPLAQHDRGASVVVFHSMASSASDPVVRHLGAVLARRGIRCFRVNHRGVGSSVRSHEIYHAGRSDDIADVVRAVVRLRPANERIAVIAFSLSANMVLRHLGMAGTSTEPAFPRQVVGSVLISPVVDLRAATVALVQGSYTVVGRLLCKLGRKQIERRHNLLPELGPSGLPPRMSPFDVMEYVARNTGFADMEDYFERATAEPWLPFVRAPVFTISAADDPMAPPSTRSWRANPCIRELETEHGGHLGFIAAARGPSGYRRWLDHAVLRIMERDLGIKPRS